MLPTGAHVLIGVPVFFAHVSEPLELPPLEPPPLDPPLLEPPLEDVDVVSSELQPLAAITAAKTNATAASGVKVLMSAV